MGRRHQKGSKFEITEKIPDLADRTQVANNKWKQGLVCHYKLQLWGFLELATLTSFRVFIIKYWGDR